MPTDFHAIIQALAQAGVRFVIAGGVAVVLHGHDRLTADLDIALELTAESVSAAIAALTRIGYRPMAPVDPMQLADPAIREAWRRDRNMTVFSLWDSTNTKPTIDIFLESPLPFEELWTNAALVELGGVNVRVVSREHLIRIKRASGRPQDLADVERLQSRKA
ncbi:MAG: hypothetical protein CMLOHMNK_00590 [Steroidobacteraceae bacterium]|nr:hypothetical protein [Steroidobacteraceae bacterium]